MRVDLTKIIPASELRRLSQGSYEHRIECIREMVEDEFEPEKAEIVACYEDRAVVSTGDAFYKVQFEAADSGTLKVTSRDPIPVDVRAENDLDDFVEQEALGIADLWIAGQPDKAKARLRALASQVKGVPGQADEKLVGSVEARVRQDRPWKRAYQERQNQIREMLGSDLDSTPLQPKFQKLYDGTTPKDKLPGFRQLVGEDLATVVARLDRISESAKTAFDGSSERLAAAQTEDSDDSGVLDLYEGFSRDLIADLEQLKRQTMIASKRVKDVGCQGKLRDVLAEGIASYEVASQFVVKVAGLLVEAQEE